jgi:catechol 2,3-dioxygenase
MRTRLEAKGITPGAPRSPLFGPHAFSVADPDGNTVIFGHEPSVRSATGAGEARRARLQHLAVASDHPERLLRFYTEVLGFALSDTVAEDGALSACWLRTDREHHTMAVFRTQQPGRRLDHHSFEVTDWGLIRDWADDLAARGVGLVWGPGRHGPGNNLFIMIRDPDDNLIEFSAELEVITNDRPPRVWPQSERTFNQWGSAALRT